MTPRPKILYISHNHPTIRPGGAEAYAFELYRAVQEDDRYEPYFLARTGPPVSTVSRYHEGTLLTGVDDDPNQYFFYTDTLEYDWLNGTPRGKAALVRYLRQLLRDLQPDLVHFQHTLFFGYDAIREVRRTLGDVPIVYTLHEFLPICHRNGQMVRTTTEKPCMAESPRRCHECFPEISPQTFFMRKRFIQSHLALVDRFLAPSRFLADRYVDWGLPEAKVRFEDYGRLPVAAAPARKDDGRRNQLAFFGQLSHYKGINVLLTAMKILDERGVDVRLTVHGANLELQPQEFRDQFGDLLAATQRTVRFEGEFNHDNLPSLMESADWVVVPSIWWENSPLVIQEATQHQRPIISSDIGGMAEKVHAGVSGLHFTAGDPADLARVIEAAVEEPSTCEHLRRGIEPVYAMADHLDAVAGHYDELLAARPWASPVAEVVGA